LRSTINVKNVFVFLQMEIDFEEEPDWMPLVKIEEGTSTVQVQFSNGNKIDR
jgi:hypothetical protein